jgi:hypothetical protein
MIGLRERALIDKGRIYDKTNRYTHVLPRLWHVLSASICFRALPAHLYIASVDSYPAIQAVFSLHERAFHLMARSILAHHST